MWFFTKKAPQNAVYDEILALRTSVHQLRTERDHFAEKADALQGENARQRGELADARKSCAEQRRQLEAWEAIHEFATGAEVEQTEALLTEALAMLMWYKEMAAYAGAHE